MYMTKDKSVKMGKALGHYQFKIFLPLGGVVEIFFKKDLEK